MPATNTVEMIVLFEDEVRAAAKALAAVSRVYDDEASTQDERAEAIRTALNACLVALDGADRKDTLLLLANRNNLIGPRGTKES